MWLPLHIPNDQYRSFVFKNINSSLDLYDWLHPHLHRKTDNSAWLTSRQVRYKVTQSLWYNGSIKGELPFWKAGKQTHAHTHTCIAHIYKSSMSVTRATGLPRPQRPHSRACPPVHNNVIPAWKKFGYCTDPTLHCKDEFIKMGGTNEITGHSEFWNADETRNCFSEINLVRQHNTHCLLWGHFALGGLIWSNWSGVRRSQESGRHHQLMLSFKSFA